ncbi:flagellar hook-basal body protein [Caulobacter sp. DWR1-3-2b1]|uniref:flagellar hook-basal body protein n=1 Tax=Caulobacter sp. DWR1-3-2b1 TaxID=2804670 RepID=UPI003CFA9869
MNGVFHIGATGLQSQQRALEITANNIANVNTPAFKRSEVRFAELVATDGPASALGGVALEGQRPVFAQGELKATGEAAHLAIRGEGFIELMGPGGRTLLWRGGVMRLNADGLLAADNGMPLKAMITAPLDAGSLLIDTGGQVRAENGDGQDVLGRIELVRPRDMAGLTAIGEGLYAIADETQLNGATPGEDGAGVLVQGALESSNVQLSAEMIALLLTQRAYAANAQIVQAGDQLMAIANGLRR